MQVVSIKTIQILRLYELINRTSSWQILVWRLVARGGTSLVQDEKILRIFDRKGYFSIHGADAEMVAQTCYKGTGVLKQLGRQGNTLSSVTVNRSLYEQVLRAALVEQADRTVELYEGHGATWTRTKYAYAVSGPELHVCYGVQLHGAQ